MSNHDHDLAPNHDLAQRMAELARATALPRDVDEVLAGVTATAVEMIPGTDTCGVLLIGKGGKFESLFGTSDLIYKLDALQEECGEGPCIEAALDELIVRTDDFQTERRWPKYSRAVSEIGVRSGLSFKLYTGASTAGALNLFGTEPHAFDMNSEAIGSILAAHAASAIIASRHGEQLVSALTTRDTIGQAKGVIMERFNVDSMRAFEMLRELSQSTNTRLVDIASRVIETRGPSSS
ncbi:GAF and ANTAR domain-containing protein [Mycolicibacterium sp. Dal123E01]|uniref:GAF and ANTAR domain-containing protein n=1 Tax=Mycolicibacterium sp. Dal123E01 TaxID=3457578 RepID=UPI00403EF630